jgi:hypothetical protein
MVFQTRKQAEYNQQSSKLYLKKHPISKQEFEKSFSIVKRKLWITGTLI